MLISVECGCTGISDKGYLRRSSKERAEYGSYLIKRLAERLEPEYGSGFGRRQLEMSRQFYRMYPIANT